MNGDAIPRQTQARRQVRRARLDVEAREDGTYVLTSPAIRGWRREVKTNPQAGAALHEVLVENTLAAYARAHGQRYDHDTATDPDPDTPATLQPTSGRRHLKGSRVSPGWECQEDGTWKSPSGLTFGADTTMVRRVVAARERAAAAEAAQQPSPPPLGLPPDRG